jgi:hypothetical protein
MRLFTFELNTGSLSISSSDGVTQMSIQANPTSSCEILGNFPFQGNTSTAIVLSNGESVTLTAPTNSPLDGITITHVSGTVDILIGF